MQIKKRKGEGAVKKERKKRRFHDGKEERKSKWRSKKSVRDKVAFMREKKMEEIVSSFL
jgi:hypothetical protein